jgi:Domain of unknown function DUF29
MRRAMIVTTKTLYETDFNQWINACYADAREQTSLETGLALDCFPQDCPYAVANVLNPDFWPQT